MVRAFEAMSQKYDEMQRLATEARVNTNAEMHALRGKIQELISKVEILLMRVDKQTGGKIDR